MKATLLFCAACAGILALAGGPVWADDVEFLTNIGLYGGSLPGGISTFAKDSTGALYMCVQGPYALYKSTDGGATWSHSNDNAMGSGVVVLADNSVIVVTEAAVQKSTDGGSTWTTLSVIPPPGFARTIALSGSDIYVGGDGLYRSSDGGSSWSHLFLPPGPGMVNNIAVSSDAIYACRNGKLYRGAPLASPSFTEKTPTDPAGIVPSFVSVDPNHSNIVYVSGTIPGNPPGSISRSDNSGENWANKTPTTPGGGAVIIAPNSSIIWTGTWHSADNGDTWTQSSPPGGFSNPNHVLFIDPADTTWNTVYASSDVCVTKTTDGGSTWTDISTGIENLEVNAVLQSPADSNVSFVASKSGLGRTSDGGSSWSWVQYGSPKFSLAATGSTVYYGENCELMVSTDNGVNFSSTNLRALFPPGTNINVVDIYIDSSTGKVYAAGDYLDTVGGDVYIYSGGTGGTWDISSRIGKPVNCITGNGSTLYAGVGDDNGTVTGGIYTSTDGGSTWAQVSALASAVVWDIQFSGSSIYAAAGNNPPPGGGGMPAASVWVSSDSGATWTESPLGSGAYEPVSAVLVDPTTPTTIYAASGNIIYRNLSSGAPGDWHVFLEEKSGVDINVLQIVASGGTTSKSSSATPSSRLRMGSSSGYYSYGGAKAIANLCPSKLECRGRDRLNIYYDLLPGSSSSEGIAVDVYLAVKVNSKYIPYTPKGLGGAFAPYVKKVPLRARSGRLAGISTGGIAPNTYYLCALLVTSGHPISNSAAWVSYLEEQPVEVQGGGPPPPKAFCQ